MSTPKDRIYSRNSVNPSIDESQPSVPTRQKRSISTPDEAKPTPQVQIQGFVSSKNNQVPLAVSFDVDDSNVKRYEALMRKHQELSHNRIRYTTMLEEVTKKIAQYETEAKKQFGVSSLEELEKLVIKLQKEEEEALNQFEKDLKEQEALLNQIERDLNSIQQ